MKGQILLIGWIVTVVLVLAALGWTLSQAASLGRLGAAAEAQRAGLTRELEATQRTIQTELTTNVDLLKEIRWSPDRATAADVLRRLADLARGGQTKFLAIAPLEQEVAPRYRKSSHRVDMNVSFLDLVDFATKVEREGGILEDVVVEAAQAKPGDAAGTADVRAQFRLTTIEPSDDVRRIMDRVLAASAKKSSSVAALALPIDERPPGTPLRDPFKLVEPPPVRRVAASGPPRPPRMTAVTPAVAEPPPPPPRPIKPVSVKGIVKFPGGVMAIVNDQIVKVGDVVDGQRVEEIADGKVVLSEPGGESRSATLPGFAAAPPTTRR